MLHRSFKPAKCKTSLKLAVSRIKLLNNKREGQIKLIKKELAQLLESGQIQTARIRVEHVFREEKTLTAYNLIEIYCELIVARLPIIESQKNCPIDLKEAIASVIFACPRCSDIPELADIKKQLTAKYGKDFVSRAIEVLPDCGVNRMLVEKLSAKAPDGQTKLKILTAIAEEHNVKWNPELFSDSDPKPAQDLLNGPNNFQAASIIHTEAPPGPVRYNYDDSTPPNAQVPPKPNENFNEKNKRSSPGSQNYASSGASPSVFHSEERSSGTPRTEQSYPRNENASSSSRQDWTMEFKDATSAAQAAAESAERASMAARAAAELSQRSAESPRSHAYSPRVEQPKSYGSSKDESQRNYGVRKGPENSSFSGRNSGRNDERVVDKGQEEVSRQNERLVRDAYKNKDGYSQKKSPRSYDDEFSDEASKKSQSSEPELKTEETSYFDQKVTRKQSSSVSHSHSSSFGDSVSRKNNDVTYYEETKSEKRPSRASSRSHSTASSDIHEDMFRRSDRGEDPSEMDSNKNTAYFDDYASDNDQYKDDLVEFKEKETPSYFSPPNRNPTIDLLADSTVWSPRRNAVVEPRKSTSPFHPSVFSQTSEVSSLSPQPEHLPPVAFDDYDSPSSDSKDDLRRSKATEREELHKVPSGTNVHSSEDSSSEDENVEQVFPVRKRKGNKSVSEKNFNDGSKSVKLQSSVHVTAEIHDFSKDSELLSESSSESGNEFKFGSLTGGLRNKGIARPPYMGKPSKKSFQTKEETENTRSDVGQFSSFPPPTVTPSVDPTRASDQEASDERSSLRQSRKTSVRTSVGRVDSDDDNLEELLQQETRINRPSFNRKSVVEPIKMPSPMASQADFDSDSSDSEEDVSKLNLPVDSDRPGPGFSRRTKASTLYSGRTRSKTTVQSEESATSNYGSESKSYFSGSRASDSLPNSSGRSYSKPISTEGAEPKSYSSGRAYPKTTKSSAESVTTSYGTESKLPSRSSQVDEASPKTTTSSSTQPPTRSYGIESKLPSRSSQVYEASPKTITISSTQPLTRSYGTESKLPSRSSQVDEDSPKTTTISSTQPQTRSYGTESKLSSRSYDDDEASPKTSGRTHSKTHVSSKESATSSYSYRLGSKSSSITSNVGENSPNTSSRAYSNANVPRRETVTPSYRSESNSSISTSYLGETVSKPFTEANSSDQMGTLGRPRLVKKDRTEPTSESRRSPRMDNSKSSPSMSEPKSNSPPNSTKPDVKEVLKAPVISRENSSNDNASHVHPKLPDSDAFTAFFQSLKQPRG